MSHDAKGRAVPGLDHPDDRAASRMTATEAHAIAVNNGHGRAMDTINRALNMLGHSRRTRVQRIDVKPELSIEGGLLANTVTVTIRQFFIEDEGSDGQ